MKYIKKISDYSIVGGMGSIMVGALVGCGDAPATPPPSQVQPQGSGIEEAAKKGSFVILEEIAPKQYKIAEEFPAKETRVVLKSLDGTEKVLTQEELDTLIKEEEKKIDAGTSALTQPQNAEASSSDGGGMGLGATLLASVAGGMMGAYLGNKLFGNQNYQNNRKASYKSPSTYARSQSSFNKARSSSSSRSSATKKSGFFKKSTPTRTSSTPARRSTNNFSSSRSSSRGG